MAFLKDCIRATLIGGQDDSEISVSLEASDTLSESSADVSDADKRGSSPLFALDLVERERTAMITVIFQLNFLVELRRTNKTWKVLIYPYRLTVERVPPLNGQETLTRHAAR